MEKVEEIDGMSGFYIINKAKILYEIRELSTSYLIKDIEKNKRKVIVKNEKLEKHRSQERTS